eukprot:2009110-Rhodomonas_salina.2
MALCFTKRANGRSATAVDQSQPSLELACPEREKETEKVPMYEAVAGVKGGEHKGVHGARTNAEQDQNSKRSDSHNPPEKNQAPDAVPPNWRGGKQRLSDDLKFEVDTLAPPADRHQLPLSSLQRHGVRACFPCLQKTLVQIHAVLHYDSQCSAAVCQYWYRETANQESFLTFMSNVHSFLAFFHLGVQHEIASGTEFRPGGRRRGREMGMGSEPENESAELERREREPRVGAEY